MKIWTISLLALLTLTASATHAAGLSDGCESTRACSTDGRLTCIASNCLEAGKLTITLSWRADTDLDLVVESPEGGRIGAMEELEADRGRITVDECYDSDRCGASEHPHVEHILWDFDDSAPTGRYRIEVINFDGRNAADFRLDILLPSGQRIVEEGAIEAEEGAVERESFVIDTSVECADRDHDGLCDSWEEVGIDVDDDGEVDLELQSAHPLRKDIYVEVDWMPGAEPFPLEPVVQAFARAPVENPDGTTGITLHIERSEEVTKLGRRRVGEQYEFDDEELGVAKFGVRNFGADATSCGAGFFGTSEDRASENCEARISAKKLVYRYALFAFKRAGTTSSGRGELPGNDFIVSTKSWRSNHQKIENATFMHELGHTLGLYHGGKNSHNCKPNYLSVMNYFYQTPALYAGRPLDYSRSKLVTVDETALIEFDGIAGPPEWEEVAFHGPDGDIVVTDTAASEPIDWNQNGDFDVDFVEVHVSDGDECSQHGVARKLESHDDWSSLIYNFRTTSNFGVAWGDSEPPDEITEEDYERLARTSDSDVDGFDNFADNCPTVANPAQRDRDEDGVGDVCDRCPDEAALGFTEGCAGVSDSASSVATDTLGAERPTFEDTEFLKASRGCAKVEGTSSWLVLALFAFVTVRRRVRRR